MSNHEQENTGGDDGERSFHERPFASSWLVETPVEYFIEAQRRRERTPQEHLVEAQRAQRMVVAAYERATVRLQVMRGSGRFTETEVDFAEELVEDLGLQLWDANGDLGDAKEGIELQLRAEASKHAEAQTIEAHRAWFRQFPDDGWAPSPPPFRP